MDTIELIDACFALTEREMPVFFGYLIGKCEDDVKTAIAATMSNEARVARLTANRERIGS
jgi:hypothetical protein